MLFYIHSLQIQTCIQDEGKGATITHSKYHIIIFYNVIKSLLILLFYPHINELNHIGFKSLTTTKFIKLRDMTITGSSSLHLYAILYHLTSFFSIIYLHLRLYFYLTSRYVYFIFFCSHTTQAHTLL